MEVLHSCHSMRKVTFAYIYEDNVCLCDMESMKSVHDKTYRKWVKMLLCHVLVTYLFMGESTFFTTLGNNV